MQLLVHLWNHNEYGKRSLEDVVGILGHQLRALGHWCVWDPENEKGKEIKFLYGPGQYNLIVEGFTAPVVDIIAKAHAQGARFICLATEEPTDKGFNHGTQKEMVWRQETFALVGKYLEGILHLVPGQRITDWYGQHAPTAYAELGFAPSLVRQPVLKPPEYDFGFFGSLTPRRRKLLQKLANMTGKPKAVKIVADFASQVTRDAAMQEAKVVLQVRKFDEMGLVSSSRCNTALNCWRPVVAEPHDVTLSKPWDEIVRFTKSEQDFFTMAFVARSMWQSMHYEQFMKFKNRLPPEVCVGDPLRKIGIH